MIRVKYVIIFFIIKTYIWSITFANFVFVIIRAKVEALI